MALRDRSRIAVGWSASPRRAILDHGRDEALAVYTVHVGDPPNESRVRSSR
jgi:hypothetical protein